MDEIGGGVSEALDEENHGNSPDVCERSRLSSIHTRKVNGAEISSIITQEQKKNEQRAFM
jgi:hypothetical protein